MKLFYKERFKVCLQGEIKMRGKLSLRTVADQSGVSASTLSRIQRGYPPDIETFFRLCEWMGISASEFATPRRHLLVSSTNTKGMWITNAKW